MGAAVFMSILIFGLVFVFTYQNTRPYAVNYVGVAIGIVSSQQSWLTEAKICFGFGSKGTSLTPSTVYRICRMQICTVVIKVVGQRTLRKRNWSCFYRKKPQTANYANLFFECWYIGTGLLVVVSRLFMFLLSSALWLGRIDVEFLDPNVKIGKVSASERVHANSLHLVLTTDSPGLFFVLLIFALMN